MPFAPPQASTRWCHRANLRNLAGCVASPDGPAFNSTPAHMSDTSAPKSSKALLGVVAALLFIMACTAALYVYKYAQSQEEVTTLTSQLEDSQDQIARLQPLAAAAKTTDAISQTTPKSRMKSAHGQTSTCFQTHALQWRELIGACRS